MNFQEYQNFQAELGVLSQMIAATPDELVIEKIGLQNRKENLEQMLAVLPRPNREPVRARLTFRGKPIFGSQGCFADFGAQAVFGFTETIAAICSSRHTPLGKRGSITDKSKYQMIITGTAVGSFGFQLEEAPCQDVTLFDIESPISLALEQIERLMQATSASDDGLTEAVAELDPRALEVFRRFLDTLVTNEAICALDFKNHSFRFADLSTLKNSYIRLCQDNIHEDRLEMIGHFEGLIPTKRLFQFQTDDHQVLVGKVDPVIANPSEINNFLAKKVEVIITKKIVGSGTPQYRLMSFKPL